MISLNECTAIHKILVIEFGGANGIRDEGSLLSALARPFQTFGEEELYVSATEKAAALIESILQNHPFVDGNKRTGYVLMRMLLLSGGFDIEASQDDKYEFVINIASGISHFDDIVKWLNEHLIQLNEG